jgi:hypothetical protein
MSARVDGTVDEGSRKLVPAKPLTYHRYVSESLFACDVCNARVGELRRGRCWGCYSRWVDERPVGMGAKCVTCPEKRRRVLRAVELYGNWKPMCFNCAGQLLHLTPMPPTLAELRAVVSRERRRTDRRWGKADSRVFRYERRVGQRRTDREEFPPIGDEMIIEVTVDPTDGMEFEDLTSIRELVTHLRPVGLAS